MNDGKTAYWHGIYDYAISELKDPEEARAEADRAVELIARGIRSEKVDQMLDKKQLKKMRFRNKLKKLEAAFPFLIILVLIGGIVTAIVFAVRSHDRSLADDYAGVTPEDVTIRGNEAVMDYYTDDKGNQDNRLSSNFKLISKTHSHFVGAEAWKVLFKDHAGKLLCAFIWSDYYDNYHILKGDACK